MPIILRQVTSSGCTTKGTPLTNVELDNNLIQSFEFIDIFENKIPAAKI